METKFGSSFPVLTPHHSTRHLLLLLGCFHLQLEVSVAQKPTHQHGPAAKHVIEPWHGSRTRSSQELFVIQQPQISQLYSNFTREERRWCALLHSFHFRHYLYTAQTLRLPNSFISSKSTSQAQTSHLAK